GDTATMQSVLDEAKKNGCTLIEATPTVNPVCAELQAMYDQYMAEGNTAAVEEVLAKAKIEGCQITQQAKQAKVNPAGAPTSEETVTVETPVAKVEDPKPIEEPGPVEESVTEEQIEVQAHLQKKVEIPEAPAEP
ncbi:MAG TPA: hypothetical protein PK299_03120, partial [Anaerolineales bacterium]|nr:hypothetical protein [Anaerolineales bacterium]